MAKIDFEEDYGLENLYKRRKQKLFNKYFKNSDNIKKSFLAVMKKQFFTITRLYFDINAINEILDEKNQNNTNKYITHYSKYIIRIFTAIDVALQTFCDMTQDTLS